MKSGEDAVAALLDVLNREGVTCMIVGSFSSNRYGVPRATHDADFVVGTKGIQWTKYLAELPEGFELDPKPAPKWSPPPIDGSLKFRHYLSPSSFSN